ncbi:hypothetical protein QYM36_000316 [Artemia franciscana]|uniref:Uncharacterized protein n=1 Tax=Artemia franciscana TaxID=6661 RepID=A0AA88I7U3_ARTSF|nr:hypothetical protein QYM36_000316 [Artemia franciscana]
MPQLKSEIARTIDESGLYNSKLLALICDGPNVNNTLFRLIYSEKSELTVSEGLLDIGTYKIHFVPNAFQKRLQEIGENCSDLIIKEYHSFSGWPARQEDYRKTQEKTGVPKSRFLKHILSRWLTIGPSALRLREQMLALSECFVVYIPKKPPSDEINCIQRDHLDNQTINHESIVSVCV